MTYQLTVIDFLRVAIMARTDERSTRGEWGETFDVFNDIAGKLNDGDEIEIIVR